MVWAGPRTPGPKERLYAMRACPFGPDPRGKKHRSVGGRHSTLHVRGSRPVAAQPDGWARPNRHGLLNVKQDYRSAADAVCISARAGGGIPAIGRKAPNRLERWWLSSPPISRARAEQRFAVIWCLSQSGLKIRCLVARVPVGSERLISAGPAMFGRGCLRPRSRNAVSGRGAQKEQELGAPAASS